MKTIALPEEQFNIDTESDDVIDTASCSFLDEEDTIYFYGDEDQQDGRYFHSGESFLDDNSEKYDRYNDALYTKKNRAVLYLHLHQELMTDEHYKKAYDKLRDDEVRSCAYWMENKAIVGPITEEDRDAENFILDLQLDEYGVDRVERYKKDAIYIVQRIAAGQSIFTY